MIIDEQGMIIDDEIGGYRWLDEAKLFLAMEVYAIALAVLPQKLPEGGLPADDLVAHGFVTPRMGLGDAGVLRTPYFKTARIESADAGAITPRSVTIPAISRAGVTSKAGL